MNDRIFRGRVLGLRKAALILVLFVWLPAACSWLGGTEMPADPAATALLSRLEQTNRSLTQFKCIGRMVLRGDDQAVQSFRVAIAGQLNDRLRMDLLAPFGGAIGSVASDGQWLYVVMHSPREYHRKALGSGSLLQFTHIDIHVAQLVEILLGRVPVDDDLSARLDRAESGSTPQLRLVDAWGRIRQEIILDETMQPVQAVWFDRRQRPFLTLILSGHRHIDEFVLPERIELIGVDGRRISLSLPHYEANAPLQPGLFSLPPPES